MYSDQKVFGQLSHILSHFITFPRPVYFRFVNSISDGKIIIAVFHMLFFQIITCKPPASQNHSHHQRTDTFNMQRNTQSLCPGENLHMHRLILTCMWYKSCPHQCLLAFLFLGSLIDRPGERVRRQRVRNIQHASGTSEESTGLSKMWTCESRTPHKSTLKKLSCRTAQNCSPRTP